MPARDSCHPPGPKCRFCYKDEKCLVRQSDFPQLPLPLFRYWRRRESLRPHSLHASSYLLLSRIDVGSPKDLRRMIELFPTMGELAKAVGNAGRQSLAQGLSFAHHLVGGEPSAAESQVTSTVASIPSRAPTTAQEESLKKLHAALQQALQEQGISLEEPFALSLDALGDIQVSEHSQKQIIEGLLASDSGLQELAKQLLQSVSQSASAAEVAANPSTASSQWIFQNAAIPADLMIDQNSARLVDAL